MAMGFSQVISRNEAAIWNRLLKPEKGDDSPEAARFLLGLAFEPADLERMHELAQKHQDDTLSDEETAELGGYRYVGLQLDLLHSKARLSLKKSANSPKT